MATIWAKQALTHSGWADDVRIDIDAGGRIAAIETAAAPAGNCVDLLLPAPVNSHSHAFQRAMAGLTERRGADAADSFWTWRQLMYQFLDQLSPEQVEAIAALVQMEMLEAGYGTNVEFHYLHHQANGQPYDKLSEMAERIAAAREISGIGLTLLPVQYQYGGCNGQVLTGGQRRFHNTPDQYARLVGELQTTLKSLPPDSRIGVAPHSLRAVAREQLQQAAALIDEGPVHIHIAEQLAEVDEVLACWGARPVEWALNNLPIDARWCLIHATQMTAEETIALAQTGAVAGLCPITESNLGDGIFDGVRWMNAGGQISIGSDSNILISLAEEMRVLEHSQRLRDHTRAALAMPDVSTGRRIFDGICRGGAQAADRGTGQIEPGQWADLLSLDMTNIDLCGLRGDTLLDAFVVAGSNSMVQDVWSAGRHLVQQGRHIRREAIIARYSAAVAALRSDR